MAHGLLRESQSVRSSSNPGGHSWLPLLSISSLCCLSTLLVSCEKTRGIEITPGLLPISEGALFQPEAEAFSQIGEFVLLNNDGFKEGRIVCRIENADSESEDDVPPIEIEVSVSDEKTPEEPFHTGFKNNEEFASRTSFSIPLRSGRNVLRFIGRNGGSEALKVVIAGNFRKTTLFCTELNEATLQRFDARYCDLQDNLGGLDRVYEVPEEYWSSSEEPFESLFAFDHGGEIKELFAEDGRITVIEDGQETITDPDEFAHGMVRLHFLFGSSVVNSDEPRFEIHSTTATIRSAKKAVGRPPGIGKSSKIFKAWNEETEVKLQDGRIVATRVTRHIAEGGSGVFRK